MTATEIVETLKAAAPQGSVTAADAADGMPTVYVDADHVVDVCRELRDAPALRFAFMADMTVVDNMPREPRFEVVLHLASFGVDGFGETAKRLRVKVRLPGATPSMPTLSGIWKAANWGEREVYDMFGIQFEGHPDMRRILMPEDWDGHPGRKDYPVQIKMTPTMYEPLQVSAQEFAANVQASRDRAAPAARGPQKGGAQKA